MAVIGLAILVRVSIRLSSERTRKIAKSSSWILKSFLATVCGTEFNKFERKNFNGRDSYVRREEWRDVRQNYFAAGIAKPGRRPENGNLVPGERINTGDKRKGDGHLLHCCSSRRDTVRRRARSNHDQGRKNRDLDRPRCWHDEERWHRELSRRSLLSNYAHRFVPAEQGRAVIPIRGRRRGQHTLRIQGMEVADSPACCGFPHRNLPSLTLRVVCVRRKNVRRILRMFV